jgi:diguanylate cyclase (GGDEF)-like protein
VAAVERLAVALDAEITAVLSEERVEASIGFAEGQLPEERLLAVARGRGGELEVPGLGTCQAISVAMEGGSPGWLLVARFGEPFAREELELMRGMGRVVSLTLRTIGLLEEERALRAQTERQTRENTRLLGSLRERQALLERLSRVQRSIAAQTALNEVLDAIVAGAAELLGDPVAALRLVDTQDPTRIEMVSSRGVGERVLERIRLAPIDSGATGEAVRTGRLVVLEDYAGSELGKADIAAAGIRAAMAAPVRERGEVAGCLVVASYAPGRTYSLSEREMLEAFAEHAGLALNDARARAETRRQAFHDALTGLANRALFANHLREALAPGRTRQAATVLFADLDGFKRVNDSLGHAAGDELLTLVARRLEHCFRPSDLIARFGGDEFAVLIDDVANRAGAAAAARRALDALRAPFNVRGREVQIAASIGVVHGRYAPDHLMRNADLAMYRAKALGRGRFEIFEPQMHAAAVERLDLESDLRRALEQGHLQLYYQPVCRLQGGEIVGVEALARWRHPKRGLIMPREMIPLAEESGLILPIGGWVLREACRQAALWQARHPSEPPLRIWVNLSGVQLGQPDLVREIAGALEEASLEPASLALEITESALMTDLEANVDALNELERLGVRLAVDDFGTGYSSLEYLRRFPVDVLKIAKPFVDGLERGPSGVALAKAIVDLGASLELSTVAEGIERPEQQEQLAELGCELGQGYRFSRPLDAAGMDSLLINAGLLGPGWFDRWSSPRLEPRSR